MRSAVSSTTSPSGCTRRAEPTRPFTWAGADEPLRPDEAPVAISRTADEVAEVVAATVLHDRDGGPVEVPVIVRLADGSRLGARAGDPALPAAVAGTTLVGRRVRIRSDGDAANVDAIGSRAC